MALTQQRYSVAPHSRRTTDSGCVDDRWSFGATICSQKTLSVAVSSRIAPSANPTAVSRPLTLPPPITTVGRQGTIGNCFTLYSSLCSNSTQRSVSTASTGAAAQLAAHHHRYSRPTDNDRELEKILDSFLDIVSFCPFNGCVECVSKWTLFISCEIRIHHSFCLWQ